MIDDDERDMKRPGAFRVSDVSALPEADRAVIAHLDAALHGARPAPGSDEAAAVAAMKRFVDGLRGAQAAARTAGLDLTCEACASVFYTGGCSDASHAAACEAAPDVRVRIDDVVEKAFAEPVETPAAGPADAPTAARHWYYPSAVIGCGLHIDDLRAIELTCLRSDVTCPGCLTQLQIDRETCEACRLGAPERVSARLAPPHVCDPSLS